MKPIVLFILMVVLLTLDSPAQAQQNQVLTDSEIGVLFSKVLEDEPVIDAKFKILGSLLVGSTVFDFETTFRAKKLAGAREANSVLAPFVNSGRLATYTLGMAVDGVALFSAYKLKEGGHKLWWIIPVSGAAIHIAAGGHNLRLIYTHKF